MAGPLEGVKVLDFTWALAGPFATMLLADLGAEVWKVEPVGIDEQERGYGPYVDGVSSYFFSVNRGKKSVVVDFSTAEGREIVRELAEHADCVVESFTPGTMEKHGLGYEKLSALNGRLVYASISGFGQTGPYRERGAMDVTIEGISGLMSLTGQPGCPPTRCGYSVADLSAGMFAATGILAALVERQRSGKGQYLDISMLDCQMTLLENALVRYLNTGEAPQASGSRHPLVTPFQAFPTKDSYITVAGVNDWTFFCWRVDRPDLADDPRFATNELRTWNHGELEAILNEVFRHRTTQEWLDTLAEVCLVSPVNTIEQAVHDPQVKQRDMIVELPTESGLSLKVANTPFKFSRSQSGPRSGAPRLGEHTDDVLLQFGVPPSEIDRLAELGVIGL